MSGYPHYCRPLPSQVVALMAEARARHVVDGEETFRTPKAAEPLTGNRKARRKAAAQARRTRKETSS